jgi:hypothetical protein
MNFVVEETNCGWGVTYYLSIGGVQLATLVPGYDCTCNPVPKTVTVTDPAGRLALTGLDADSHGLSRLGNRFLCNDRAVG